MLLQLFKMPSRVDEQYLKFVGIKMSYNKEMLNEMAEREIIMSMKNTDVKYIYTDKNNQRKCVVFI